MRERGGFGCPVSFSISFEYRTTMTHPGSTAHRLLQLAALAQVVILSLLLSVPAPLHAQAPQTLVSATRLTEISPTESQITVDVERLLPPFSVANNDSTQIEFVLVNSRRGPGATFDNPATANLRNVEFRQNGRNLSIIVTGKAVLHATAAADTPQRVTIAFTSDPVQTTAAQTGPYDQAPVASSMQSYANYEMVQLKYADVSEVVGILTQGATVAPNDSFVPREPAFGSNSLTGNNYTSNFTPPPATNSDQPLGQSIDDSIAIDRRLNAIWLRGSPERIAELKAMIEKIDIPVDSVLLETELVELTESGAKAVGIDFTNANGQIAVATAQSGQYIPFGIPPSNGGSLNAGGYFTGGYLTSGSLQAAIYAQVQKGQGKIVSKPRISAQSGSTAKIITGDALPILTSITLSGVNGVSQQVQYVNVGVTLQIAPRVSSDGFVSSHVFCVVSSVSGYSQGYPTISQREAETSATVRDGESFIIGGLTQESTLSSRTKIPLLGDLPLIGQAFRTDKSSKAKTDLYIVVTPHIVRRAAPQQPLPLTVSEELQPQQ
jgi:general secretion pathway protein D